MSAPRFFVSDGVAAGALISLEADDARHAAGVLRCKSGEPLTVLSSGIAWDAIFATVGRTSVIVRALRPAVNQGGELPAAVTVLQALTKGSKFDEVVEKTVELGATRIVPVICARSEAEGGPNKVERWRRIARAAAMQSRRRFVPPVDAPLTWLDALAQQASGAFTIVAYEGAPLGTLAQALRNYKRGATIIIAVGPEGGLRSDEADAACALGAHAVSLGPTILRTETAAAGLLAAIASGVGWW